jgi:hypothetical protein
LLILRPKGDWTQLPPGGTSRGLRAPISFAAPAPSQLLFDTRFVVWENLPQRKTGIEQSVAARLTCPCPLIVFVARCALAARLTHYLSGWCGTGSQLLGRNISGMLTLEMFQIHGHLNLRTSCQFALGISPGSDRKKRRRSALSICATRLIAATRYVHRCHRAGRPGHVPR